MVPRKDLDTKQRMNRETSNRQTPRTPTSRIQRDGKNYQTHQPTILLAKDKARY